MTGKALDFLKYYYVADSSKSQIARRGDHWSPYFKLFKLFFPYKTTAPKNANPALFVALIRLQTSTSTPTNSKALFGKESCQRSWLRDWLGKLFEQISAMKYQTEQTTNLPSLYPRGMTCKGGCRQSRQEGWLKQLFAVKLSSVQNCETTPQTANAASSPCTVEGRL